MTLADAIRTERDETIRPPADADHEQPAQPFRYVAPEGVCPHCCRSLLVCPCRVVSEGRRLVVETPERLTVPQEWRESGSSDSPINTR